LKKILSIAALFSILFFSSCNENILVDQFHSIPESGWHYEHTIIDSFEVTNPAFYHQYFLNLRVDGDYAYSNLHVKLITTAPDSSSREEILTVTLAEKSGKWLGKGLGDVLTFQIPILEKLELKQKGKYTVSLEQHMRLESLPHILSAGIKVEQQEEIF
jgi:gliding motility-associated lipoprotein GldH